MNAVKQRIVSFPSQLHTIQTLIDVGESLTKVSRTSRWLIRRSIPTLPFFPMVSTRSTKRRSRSPAANVSDARPEKAARKSKEVPEKVDESSNAVNVVLLDIGRRWSERPYPRLPESG